MTGQQVGKLTVVSRAGTRSSSALWACHCQCGGQVLRTLQSLQRSISRGFEASCGCSNRRKSHLQSSSRTYQTWANMLQRCSNPKTPTYKHYGGRGILVCERWRSFTNFLQDMGLKPTQKHGIERLDNNRGYYPGNCVWATQKVQVRNRRVTVRVGAKPLAAIAEEAGVSYNTVYHRLFEAGMPVEQVASPTRLKRRFWKRPRASLTESAYETLAGMGTLGKSLPDQSSSESTEAVLGTNT